MLAGCRFTFFSLSKRRLPTCGRRLSPVIGTWCFCQCPFLVSTHSVCLIPICSCQSLWPGDWYQLHVDWYTTWGTHQGQPLPARESYCHSDRLENQMKGVHTIPKSTLRLAPTSECRNKKIFKGGLGGLRICSQKPQKLFPLTFSV